jgi:hypothetical protein
MKHKYFGWEFKTAVVAAAHKFCSDLGLPRVNIYWNGGITTAGINNHGTIYLANVKDDAVLTLRDLHKYTGFVVHEFLHWKYTNFNVRSDDQYVSALHNGIEDAWIEHQGIAAKLTGNIASLLNVLIDEMATESMTKVKDWGDPRQYPFVLAVYLRDHATVKVPLADGLQPIFDEAKRRTMLCKSSADTLFVAEWVFKQLNALPQNPQQNKADDRTQEADSADGEPDGNPTDGDPSQDASNSPQSAGKGKPKVTPATAPSKGSKTVKAAKAEPQTKAPEGTGDGGTFNTEDVRTNAYHVGDIRHYPINF